MKNATPSDTVIKNIILEISEIISFSEEFIKSGHNDAPNFLIENTLLVRKFDKILNSIEQARLLGYITEKQFTEIKSYFWIENKSITDALLSISTEYLNTNKGGHIADIVSSIFPQTEKNFFIERMFKLKKSIEKLLSKSEKAKNIIKGLKQPVYWEQITMLFDGHSFKVKQDDKSLGEYTLEDLNFPKKKTGKNSRNVQAFFLALFLSPIDRQRAKNLLDYKDTNNQKLKSSFVKILNNAFDTNKDPVRKKDGIYTPIFNAGFNSELKINNHRSGGPLFENQEY